MIMSKLAMVSIYPFMYKFMESCLFFNAFFQSSNMLIMLSDIFLSVLLGC